MLPINGIGVSAKRHVPHVLQQMLHTHGKFGLILLLRENKFNAETLELERFEDWPKNTQSVIGNYPVKNFQSLLFRRKRMKSNQEIIDFVQTLPTDESGALSLTPEELATSLMWWLRDLPNPHPGIQVGNHNTQWNNFS